MWASRPVFISSTFLDMHAERDHLRRFVFPALEERLRARRLHLEWVDLRVGVAGAGEPDLAAREMQVLKVCLSEVHRCRPFLLVLVGDRYGWSPPRERIRAVAKEAGLHFETEGCSVTELEIEYGVLAIAAHQVRAVVYFRDPLPYQDMPREMREAFSEADSDNARRLLQLKLRIVDALPDQVRTYALRWDRHSGQFDGLEEWGHRILEDLWGALTADVEDAAAVPVSWQAEEHALLDAFIEQRGRDFVGRRAVVDALLAHATGQSANWAICVTGGAGAGKSAIFSALHRRLRGAGVVLLLAHAAGAGPRAASLNLMLRRWIDELGEATGAAVEVADDATAPDVERTFADLLARVCETRRVVVLIDALDQFEVGVRTQYMSWLPPVWPANARLIATAIAGEPTSALVERGARMQPLPGLDAAESAAIVEAVCARYHRTLEPEVTGALLAHSAAAQPLWLVLAAEEVNLIDADDLARAAHRYDGAPAERLRAMMVDRASNLPGDVPGLYAASFDHAEQLFGRMFAVSFVSLLALGRGGWRELDFRALIPQLTGETWDELRFAQLRRIFRGQIAQTGVQAQWNCVHAQMRVAARVRLAATPLSEPLLHALIARHLLSLPADDPLRCTEAMRHLMMSADWARAAAYFGDETLRDAELSGAISAVVDLVADAPEGDGLNPIAALLAAFDPADARADVAVQRCLFGVRPPLAARASNRTQRMFFDLVTRTADRLVKARPDDVERRLALSTAHLARGILFAEAGDRPAARAALETALDIAAGLNSKNPRDMVPLRQMLIVQQKLAGVLSEEGRLDAVTRMRRTSLAIAKQLVELQPADAEVRHELAAAQEAVAQSLVASGELAEAKQFLREAVESTHALAAQNPGIALLVEHEAIALTRLAELQGGDNELAMAEASVRTAVGILETLVAQRPDARSSRANLAIATSTLGELLAMRMDFIGAFAAYTRAREILERLTQRDPSNAEWRRSLGIACFQQAKMLLEKGDHAEAAAAIEKALSLIAPLAASDPSNMQWVRDLAGFHRLRGDQHSATDDWRGAQVSYAEALRLTELWAENDDSTEARRNLAMCHDALGHALLANNDIDGAEASIRASMDIMEGLVDRDQANTGWWRDLAGVHQSMAEVAKARHDWPAAARWQAAAADSLQRIATDRGDSFRARFELARELVKLGESQLQSGDFRMVAQTLRRALDVTALEPPPEMRKPYAELITNAYMFLGIALNESEPAEAVAPLRQAMTFIGRWVEREPDRPDWRRALASVGEDLAQALSATEDWDEARPVYATAVEAWTYLTRVRDDAAFRRGLARTQLALARCLISSGDIRGAIRAAGPARATLAQREREDTANPTASLAYFEFVHALGETYLRNSQWDEVDALFSEAMPVVERYIARRPDSDALRMQLVQMAWTRAQVMHKKGRHDAAVGFRRRTRDELRALASRGVPLGEQMAALLRKLEERG